MGKLQVRLATISVGLVVTVMFAVTLRVLPEVRKLAGGYQFLTVVAGGLGSVGIYRLLLKGTLVAFGHWRWLREQVLGTSYIEGTWVGCYLSGGEKRYTVEYIDQSEPLITLQGRAFDDQGRTQVSWLAATVALKRDRLIYAYTCDVLSKSVSQQGIGVFTLVREGRGPAQKLDGYSVDVIDGDRTANSEVKVSSGRIADETALAAARDRFA